VGFTHLPQHLSLVLRALAFDKEAGSLEGEPDISFGIELRLEAESTQTRRGSKLKTEVSPVILEEADDSFAALAGLALWRTHADV
jgi:hypothetical protein